MHKELFLEKCLNLSDQSVVQKLLEDAQTIHVKQNSLLIEAGEVQQRVLILVEGVARGFLLDSGHEDVPALAKRAWECGNAAQNMLVKARVDTLVVQGEVRGRVETPNVPALEAIGGTGDIVAGLVSAMLHAGLAMERACLVAARAARRAGELACPTPATQVTDILAHMEQAVEETLKSEERIES